MKKTSDTPAFDLNDRAFKVKAWYLEEQADALIEIQYKDKMIREFIFPAYKIWNIAAHFSDIVDGELSKDNKEHG